jgi:hypothetical protein
MTYNQGNKGGSQKDGRKSALESVYQWAYEQMKREEQ